MDTRDSVVRAPDLPNARDMRRFWTAWLAVILVMLAAIVVVVLIAAVNADPPHVSPAG